MENNEKNIQSVLQGKVNTLLVTKYDFTVDDAGETVDASVFKEPGMWNVNADAEEIAKYLASDENDD